MAQKKKKSHPVKRFFIRLFLGTSLLGLIVACIAAYIVFGYVKPFYDRAQEYDLTQIDQLEHPSIILDRKGHEIGRIYVKNRSLITIEEIPDILIDCLISQEDQRFWEHQGVDWIGLLRMVYLNLKAGEITQGASTITMQLARNAFDLKSEALERGEGGTERKLVEIFLAHRIGSKYFSISGKKYVLENYMNRVPFGHGYYGVRSAALGYFGKEPKNLTTAEAASMVACIKNPSLLSPIRNPTINKKGRDHVFKRLMDDGTITQSEYNNLIQVPVVTNPKPIRRGTSHIYEKVGSNFQEILGEEAVSTGGYKIHTTIDLEVQRTAELALKQQLKKIEEHPEYSHPKYKDFDRSKGFPKYLQGAVLIHDPKTGDVIAYVGGRNYSHTQFDFIELAKRPMGTASLPFLYALAIEEGRPPSSTILDEPIDNRLVMIGGREGILGEWGQETLTPKYEGLIPLQKALAHSKIASSIRLGKELGIEKFITYCERFGIPSPKKDQLVTRDLLGSTPISVKEGAMAYSAFANNGKIPKKLNLITRIESSNGMIAYLPNKEQGYQTNNVIDSVTAYQIDSVLRGISSKDGNLKDKSDRLNDIEFAGGTKTGTPYNFGDAWAFAYNEHFVFSSWIGFQQGYRGAILPTGFSSDIAYPVAMETISSMDEYKLTSIPRRPVNIVSREVCKVSGLLATKYCFTANDSENGGYHSTTCTGLFKSGNEPRKRCGVHLGLKKNESFVTKYAPVRGETAARPFIVVDAVKQTSSAIVGNDPYGAIAYSNPTVEEEKKVSLPVLYSNSQIILNDSIYGEAQANLSLPKPKKLALQVPITEINPLSQKAIVID